MYNLGRNFNMVFHNQRKTEARRFFLSQHENTPEHYIPQEEEYMEDVTDKIIVSVECGELNKENNLPDIIGVLVPMPKDKLIKIHEIGDSMLWFKLFRDDKHIATFLKDDEPSVYTIDEYLEYMGETEGEEGLCIKEDFIKLINHYTKGHSQIITLKDYEEKDILIAVGL